MAADNSCLVQCFSYCPDPLGIVPAEQLNKLEFVGMPPQAMRAPCSAFRDCPDPLGIVPAEQFDKLEFGVLLQQIYDSKDNRKNCSL